MAKSKNIRVLMLLDFLNISGTKTHVRNLANYFIPRGIHVVVAGKKGPYSEILEQAGCKVYHINFHGKAQKIKTKLEKVITREKINIIHNHSPFSGIHAAEISKELDIPLVATFHGTNYNKDKMLRIYNASKRAISVSPAVNAYWSQLGVDSEYIPFTINLEEFILKSQTTIRMQFGIPSGLPIILYPARMEGKKARIGFCVMEACRKLRKIPGLHNLQCVIAGEGKRLNKIKSKAEEYNSQDGEKYIHVIGKYYDMPSLYSASSVVVGTGTSALEAMACERPLIAAGAQGFIGIVDKTNFKKAWNNGFGDHKFDKLPRLNKALLVGSLKEILLFPDKMNQLGSMGRKIVKNHFDESINDRIIDIYQSQLFGAGK